MQHGIDVNFKRFALVLTNNSGKVFGILNAFTAFSEIYIDDMQAIILKFQEEQKSNMTASSSKKSSKKAKIEDITKKTLANEAV